jgi:hypothetical protein
MFYVPVILITALLFFNKIESSPFIYIVYNTLIVLVFVPNLILHQFGLIHLGILVSILFLIVTLILLDKIKFSFGGNPLDSSLSMCGLILLVLVMIAPFLLEHGFNLNFRNLLLEDIYSTRTAGRDKNFMFSGYIEPWLTKVVLPMLVIFAFIKKQWLILAFSLLFMIYMFLAAGHKTVLFSILFITAMSFGRDYYHKFSGILMGIAFILCVSRLVHATTGMFFLDTIFARRLFFIPALFNQYYFEFFSGNHTYLGHSVLRNFVDYPFDAHPPFLIGRAYFNSEVTSANNGIISDGYMNFGYIGVVLFSFLASLYFVFLRSLRISHRFFGLIFLYIFSFISGAFLTSLLTKGGILIVLLGSIFLKKSAHRF